MRRFRPLQWLRRCVAAISILACTPCVLDAHDGPHDQIVQLTAQIAREPQRAELYLRRADLFRLDGNLAKAAVDLDRAEKLDPALSDIDLARARLFVALKQLRNAEAAATRFINRSPRHLGALQLRADVRRDLGLRAGALDDLTAILTIQPTPDAFIERSRLLQSPPADDVAALKGIEEGIARLGSIVTLELEAIAIERRLHRYDAALKRIDVQAARASRKETWLVRRAEILEDAGRPDDARIAYQSALTAIAALPDHLRATRATSDLASRIRTTLDRLPSRPRAPAATRSIS
jgi:tetratricopeptide (TPR) repeat protein